MPGAQTVSVVAVAGSVSTSGSAATAGADAAVLACGKETTSALPQMLPGALW